MTKIKSSNYISTDANNINSYIQNISSDISKMKTLINSVSSSWVGEDASAFIERYKSIFDKLDDFEKNLKE